MAPGAEVGWSKRHSVAAEAMKQAMGGRVEISIVDNVFQPQDAERVFRGFAASGHRLIYGTTFSHASATARVAPQFPDVAFDNCGGQRILGNLGAFDGKYFEGAFVAGIAAGKMSKTARLGVIGGFPIPADVGPANALLLGARTVRPDATCTVIFLNSWSDPGKEKEATLALIAQGCDVICSLTDTPAAIQTAEQNGVWAIAFADDMRRFAPTRQLTAFTLDWSSIYIKDARDVIAGAWKPQWRWQGLKEGVIKMSPYADSVPSDVRAFLSKSEDDVRSRALLPFAGEIKDQDGTVRVAKGAVLSDSGIRNMDWLAAGMVGQLKT